MLLKVGVREGCRAVTGGSNSERMPPTPSWIACWSIFGYRTVPEMGEPDFSTEIDTDFGSIVGSGTALGRSRDASGGGSGLPGAGKRARSSGLQQIGAHRRATEWAGWLAGLSWLGWPGLQGVPYNVPEVSAPFGRGPRAVGPQPKT